MGQRVEYGTPRRLNTFSVSLILLALAGGYWMWRFFPTYLDAWTVDHVLRETASDIYRANNLTEPERTNRMRELLDKAKTDIRKQAEIKDPDLTVSANLEETSAVLTAEYTVRITHPLVSRTTVMHFVRVEKADLKRVDWDKK